MVDSFQMWNWKPILDYFNQKNVILEENGNKQIFFCVDTTRITQKDLIQSLAKRFDKKVKHDFGFEALFDPWHVVLTLDLAFCRSINFEFVLKSKINQYTTDSGAEIYDPKLKQDETSEKEEAQSE